MVCITSIAAHDSGRMEHMGLHRALVARRANLGDCPDAASVLRRLACLPRTQHPACVVPLPHRARGHLSTAELALQVSRQALGQREGLDPQSVGALIYCHATPDARTTDSTAGRLQFDLNLRRACAFSVSQAHNTALLISLDIAAGFIHGPEASESVLLVAADKLLFGKAPNVARRMVWSDVAAAALLTREAESGWRVDTLRLGHHATAYDASRAWPADELDAFAQRIAESLVHTLAEAGVSPPELAAVITGSADPAFAEWVLRLAGIDPAITRGGSGLRAHHAGSADVLARLASLEGQIAPGKLVLAWSHGNNGEFACTVMTRIG